MTRLWPWSDRLCAAKVSADYPASRIDQSPKYNHDVGFCGASHCFLVAGMRDKNAQKGSKIRGWAYTLDPRHSPKRSCFFWKPINSQTKNPHLLRLRNCTVLRILRNVCNKSYVNCCSIGQTHHHWDRAKSHGSNMARSNEPTEEPTFGNRSPNRRNLNCSNRLKPSWMKMGNSKNINPYQSTTYKSTQIVPPSRQDWQPNPFLHTCKKATLHFDTKNICAHKSRVFFSPDMFAEFVNRLPRPWGHEDAVAMVQQLFQSLEELSQSMQARDMICMLFCLDNQRRETGRCIYIYINVIIASEHTKEVNKTTNNSFWKLLLELTIFKASLFCFPKCHWILTNTPQV